MVLDSGSLSTYRDQELSEIKRKKRRVIRRRAFIALVILCGLSFFYFSWNSQRSRLGGVDERPSRSEELLVQADLQRDWLDRHATALEYGVYDSLESFLLSDEEDDDDEMDPPGFFSEAGFQLKAVALRFVFFVVASLRIWMLAAGLGLMVGARHLRPYEERDILGLTGNTRLFFSGIRASLGRRGAEPDTFIPGLACPARCSQRELSDSALGSLLMRTGTLNATNAYLASVIVAHGRMPAFAVLPEDEALLERFAEPMTLEENACGIAESVLSLYHGFRSDQVEPVVMLMQPGEKRLSVDAYRMLLRSSLARVLQPSMREALALLSPQELLTTLLAIEAGKVLVHRIENERWVSGSAFPHLSARAILHAAPAFGDEYSMVRRAQIRQALVYASRYNPFGIVRFPVDLDETARALRQWSEILLAPPHELQVVADEVELFGLVSKANQNFRRALFERIVSLEHFASDEVYTAGTNLILMPLGALVKLMRQSLGDEMVKRLEELVFVVSQKQSLREMSASRKVDEDTSQPSYRILKPLTFPVMKRLAEMHGVELSVIKDWSSLRVVLSSFSWLARRVGNASVPESGVIFVLLHPENAPLEAVKGKEALVPLRGSRIRERFGPTWQSHFLSADSAVMAETREEFERLVALGSRAFLDPDDENREGA